MTGPLPMIIAGCSRRKTPTAVPVPAIDLYQGGCIPALRGLARDRPGLAGRTWILSARHGLLHSATPILPYDQRMTPARAAELAPQAGQVLADEFGRGGTPPDILVIAEPLYQHALTALHALTGPSRVRWLGNPAADWTRARAIIREWSLP